MKVIKRGCFMLVLLLFTFAMFDAFTASGQSNQILATLDDGGGGGGLNTTTTNLSKIRTSQRTTTERTTDLSKIRTSQRTTTDLSKIRTSERTPRTTTAKDNKNLPPIVIDIEIPITPDPYDYDIGDKYIGTFISGISGASFSGEPLTCGDRVYVEECFRVSGSDICTVSRINGKSVSNTQVYEAALRDQQPSDKECNNLYTLGGTIYKDAELKEPVSEVGCGEKVTVLECKSGSCKVMHNNTTVYVRDSMITDNKPECHKENRYYANLSGAMYYTEELMLMGTEKRLSCGAEVVLLDGGFDQCDYTETVPQGMAATTDYRPFCRAEYDGREIYVRASHLTEHKPSEKECTGDCVPPKRLVNQTYKDNVSVRVCYEYSEREKQVVAIEEDEFSVFSCAEGYRRVMKEDFDSNTCKSVSSSSNVKKCSKVFNYACVANSRPSVRGSGGLVGANHRGIISLTGKDSVNNTGLRGYSVYTESVPTLFSRWIAFADRNYTVQLEASAGTYFAAVMTNDNAMSYPLTLSVHDSDASTTADVSIGSVDGSRIFNPRPLVADETISFNDTIVSRDYVRLSNKFINDSLLASGFDLFKTGYELTVDSDKVAVYATLTSEDAKYVDGYGPRTVDLEYGRNIVLVKIENNRGKQRTYTFVVYREDTRENENTLSTLTTSIGNFNFDPYVSEYTISIPKNSKSVNVNGTLSSSSSAFVEGYEPRTVQLTEEITSVIIKTVSEAGIVRNYTLTFVKSGSEATDNIANSVNLSSLTIPGTDLKFEKSITSYNVSVEYEIELIPVYAFPESENATVEVRGNLGLKVGPNKLEIAVKNGARTQIYNVFINRKEDTLGVSNSTKLKTLTAKGYDLNFDPDHKDYVIKIKREKSLLLTATPESNRSEVYMYGNNNLTAFSIVRVKVIAENGNEEVYSIDIVKDIYDKQFEKTAAIVGSIIIAGVAIILVINKKRKSYQEYVGS